MPNICLALCSNLSRKKKGPRHKKCHYLAAILYLLFLFGKPICQVALAKLSFSQEGRGPKAKSLAFSLRWGPPILLDTYGCETWPHSPMFMVCFQDEVFPYPEPTDDQQETLQMMVDPVERFFTEKGTRKSIEKQ